jgi:hypothetical protein
MVEHRQANTAATEEWFTVLAWGSVNNLGEPTEEYVQELGFATWVAKQLHGSLSFSFSSSTFLVCTSEYGHDVGEASTLGSAYCPPT